MFFWFFFSIFWPLWLMMRKEASKWYRPGGETHLFLYFPAVFSFFKNEETLVGSRFSLTYLTVVLYVT